MKKLMKELKRVRKNISVVKSGYHKYGGFYYYLLEDIYHAIKESDTSLFFYPVTFSYVDGKIHAVLKIAELESGETIRFRTVGEPNVMKGAQAAQNAGSDVTYHTKYLLGLALQLDDGMTDPDRNELTDQDQNTGPQTETRSTAQDRNTRPQKEAQTKGNDKEKSFRKHFYKVLRKTGHDLAEIGKMTNKKWGKSISEISIEQMKTAMEGLIKQVYKKAGKQYPGIDPRQTTEKIIEKLKEDEVI